LGILGTETRQNHNNFIYMNTNQSTGMKALATAGFIVLVALLVWLAVTLVSLLPNAFSSLASLAEGLQQARPSTELVVASGSSIVNNGEDFTINWTNLNRSGEYTLFYECTDGVAIDMRFPANNITAVPCGETIKLGNAITSLELIARSEKTRFIDVNYAVGFIPTGETAVAYTNSNTFTVVNVNIPQSQSIVAESDEPAGEVAGESTEVVTETPTPAPTTPVTPREPEVTAVEIFELPSSDPDGFVDLAVKYVAVGRLTNDNRFVRGGVIDSDTRGAFQFEVRNLGTKTSDDWSFEATLTSGATYQSETQDGLLPNEVARFTLGFDNVGETGAQRFGVEIDVPQDRNSDNDEFSWAVNVVE
jgi:hypothetical protein